MLDSASIIAVAEKTKDVLQQGQALVSVLTGFALAVVAWVGYLLGVIRGKKKAAGTKPE